MMLCVNGDLLYEIQPAQIKFSALPWCIDLVLPFIVDRTDYEFSPE